MDKTHCEIMNKPSSFVKLSPGASDVTPFIAIGFDVTNGLLSAPCANSWTDALDCVFALPTTGIILNVALRIGLDRVLTTAIVSVEDAENLISENLKKPHNNLNEANNKKMKII